VSRILLDTQIVLWAIGGHRRLPREARRLIDRSEVFVSSASIWEMAIKSSLGKLDADPTAVNEALAPSGFEPLDVSGEHAAYVAQLPPHHRDPFDRLLLAQSALEALVFLTTDRQLAPYGGLVRIV
jgi:PIN domain nuclease of toxin-antitoxin system